MLTLGEAGGLLCLADSGKGLDEAINLVYRKTSEIAPG